MKASILIVILACSAVVACNEATPEGNIAPTTDITSGMSGQEAVNDSESAPDIVKIAVGSKDHTTLVAALKQAEYVNDLANAGPFTVFAPTNDAFAKLPAGTIENLMKPENKATLQDILEYHVAVGVYKKEFMFDGQKINQANLQNIEISVKDGEVLINGSARILAAVPASNGLVYVIDQVLLPPAK